MIRHEQAEVSKLGAYIADLWNGVQPGATSGTALQAHIRTSHPSTNTHFHIVTSRISSYYIQISAIKFLTTFELCATKFLRLVSLKIQ